MTEGDVGGFAGAAEGVGDCGAPLGVVDGVDADCAEVSEEDSLEGLWGLGIGGSVVSVCVGVVAGGVAGGLVVVGVVRGPADARDAWAEVQWEGDGAENFECFGAADLEAVCVEGCDVEAVGGGEGVVCGLQ